MTHYRAQLLDQVMPKGGVGAELGVFQGEFSRILLDDLAPTKLHLIDPWYLQGPVWLWGEHLSAVEGLIGVLRSFTPELVSGRVVLHIEDDRKALATFPVDYFDWAYIDSVHNYEHCSAELRLLANRVKHGGIIAGDDYVTDPAHQFHGVCRAVREFTDREPYDFVYTSQVDNQFAIKRR